MQEEPATYRVSVFVLSQEFMSQDVYSIEHYFIRNLALKSLCKLAKTNSPHVLTGEITLFI